MNFILSIFLMSFIACAKSLTAPKDPLWERTDCARCRMTLSEKSFAVQRILETGEVLYYDDLNCAVEHKVGHAKHKLYVRPSGQEEWVEAEKVRYQSGLKTPMNSGIGAVKSGGDLDFQQMLKKLE